MNKTIGLIASLIFALATIGGFYWLWTLSKDFTIKTTVADDMRPVEIDTVKDQAVSLLAGLNNVSGMPIPTPTNKMGKTNPFQ
jgi:hypothetical protein